MKFLLTASLFILSAASFAQKKIAPEQAAQHVGDSLQVSGKVYGCVKLADAVLGKLGGKKAEQPGRLD